MGINNVAFGVADRIEMVEDVATGKRTYKYNIIKEFSGNRKIKDMFAWFEKSPYKRLVIVQPEGHYSSFSSFRGAFSFELWDRVPPETYFTVSARNKQLYLEKLGGGQNETSSSV